MATERRIVLAALGLIALGGCTKLTECRDQTVLLTVSLDGTSATADNLQIAVTVDGAVKDASVAHQAGSTSGSVEVRFPSGYPSGHAVTIEVTALAGGNVVGSGTSTSTLPKGCATLGVSVTGSGVTGDDLSGTGDDLSSGAVADLSGAVVHDLAMCASSTENCFNGVDDNCDGLIDCADPQCTGGATPAAECVPNPGSATGGTLVTGASCPTAYPTSAALHTGLTAGSCGNGSCACNNGASSNPDCTVSFTLKGSTIGSCNVIGGTAVFTNATPASGCISFASTNPASYYDLTTPALTGGACNAPSSGTAQKIAPTWANNYAFCSGSAVGGGCGANQICVPAAPKHCIVETGNQVACTTTGYTVQDTTAYLSGFDDSLRDCNCTCGFTTASCGTGGPFWSGSACVNLGTFVGAGCQKGLSFDHAKINAPSNATCNAGTSIAGSTSTTGFERTVCCTN